MTEAEWLAWTDREKLLKFLRGKATIGQFLSWFHTGLVAK